MLSVLKSAWRVVARRSISDKAVLAAAAITVLLAIMSMAAGPIYADAVTTGSLRRSLADAPIAEANLVVTTRVEPAGFSADDQLVQDAVTDVFRNTGGELYRRGTSDSYAPIGLPGEHDNDLVVFRFFTDIEPRIEVVAGSWPVTTDDVVEVAVVESTAAALSLSVGDRFEVASRRAPDETTEVAIAAVYRIVDRTDPYWYGDNLDVEGVDEGVSFTTYGPLLVTPETYFATVGMGTSNMRWTVFPRHDQLTADAVGGLISRINGLPDRLNADRSIANLMQTTTGLGTLLSGTERSLLVTRAAVLVVTVQLAILAAYALLLTAGLLADVRQVESTTLVARGGEGRQLLAMSVMEGLLLTVPALAIGPPLTAAILRSFNRWGPLAEVGVPIEPTVNGASWQLAALAAVMCVAAIAVPSYRSVRRTGSIRARRARPVVGLARRAGADLALLAVAGIGLWQLSRYGAALTRTVRGRLGVDPLLVAAPAIALLAGAVLALRIMPLLARASEVVVARGRQAVTGLAVWHLGRQPHRYVRSALLLMLAVGMSFFALAYDATWRHSQRDQAEFQIGADVQVAPARQAADSIPDAYLRKAYQQLPGFESASPVLETKGSIPGATLPIQYVLLDAATAPQTVAFRPDLADEPLDALMEPLAEDRRRLPGVVLDGEPTGLGLTVTTDLEPPSQISVDMMPEASYSLNADLRLVVADTYGTVFRVDMGRLEATGRPVQMTGRLDYTAPTGEHFTPSYPIRIVGVEVRSLATLSPASPRTAHLVITGPVAVSDNGSQSFDLKPVVGEDLVSDLRSPAEPVALAHGWNENGELAIDLVTGSTTVRTRPNTYFMLRAANPPPGAPIPILASADLMEELRLGIGDTVPLETLSGYTGRGLIAGSVEAFPTIDPSLSHVVVLDYETYITSVFGPGTGPLPPDNYWLSVAADNQETSTELLRATPFSSAHAITSVERRQELALDPVALGSLGALLMSIFAAAAMALIAFVVNMTVSTRDRIGQFALMRAVGLSTRQLVMWVAFENGAVIVFGLLAGTGLGMLLATIALPLLTVTQEATAIVPELLIVHPWLAILTADIAMLAALGASVAVAARMLRRLQTAALLRTGDG
jgi:hypothetical protein